MRFQTRYPRCTACRLPQILCLCTATPTHSSFCQLIILMHESEQHKTTNTGLLLRTCIPMTTIIFYDRHWKEALHKAIGTKKPYILFPANNAISTSTMRSQHASLDEVAMIIPDGTWPQASKIRRHVTEFFHAPCVQTTTHLSFFNTEYTNLHSLRRKPDAQSLNTMEATINLLHELHHPQDMIHSMQHFLHRFVARTLWMRGVLASHEVFGGIPEGLTLQTLIDASPEMTANSINVVPHP